MSSVCLTPLHALPDQPTHRHAPSTSPLRSAAASSLYPSYSVSSRLAKLLSGSEVWVLERPYTSRGAPGEVMERSELSSREPSPCKGAAKVVGKAAGER